jgi:hypothetical protein
MESLLPLDNALVTTIQDLKQQQHAASVSTQNYIGGWYPLLSTLYTYNADNVINVAGIEIDKFSLGQMLWIIQGGSAKYFYVTKVDKVNGLIKVNAGNEYTYTNIDIDKIYIATSSNPVGFPPAFSVTIAATDTSNESISSQDCNLYMINGLVILNFQTENWNKTGSATATVQGDLPIKGNPNRMHWHAGIALRSNATPVAGRLQINGNTFVLYRLDGGTFAASGLAAIGATFNITYLCDE